MLRCGVLKIAIIYGLVLRIHGERDVCKVSSCIDPRGITCNRALQNCGSCLKWNSDISMIASCEQAIDFDECSSEFIYCSSDTSPIPTTNQPISTTSRPTQGPISPNTTLIPIPTNNSNAAIFIPPTTATIILPTSTPVVDESSSSTIYYVVSAVCVVALAGVAWCILFSLQRRKKQEEDIQVNYVPMKEGDELCKSAAPTSLQFDRISIPSPLRHSHSSQESLHEDLWGNVRPNDDVFNSMTTPKYYQGTS